MPSIVTVNVTQTVGPTPATLQSSGALISQGATSTSPGTSSLLTQLSDLTPLLQLSKAITAMTWASSTVTATVSSGHGYTVGDTLPVTIAGVAPTGYNGNYTITVTSSTQFTYALASNPGSVTVQGTVVVQDEAELYAMATTFFAQGTGQSVYVLELGPGNANDGVAALQSYITANPNSNYTPGSTGYFYAYLVPREWDGNTNFLSMLANFESTTSKTYFFITTNLTNYVSYTNLMKDAFTLIEAPAYGVWSANALTAISYASGVVTASTTTAHGVLVGQWFTISGCTPAGYNGTFQAQAGTTGTTLVYNLSSNPGTQTVLGTLQASLYASAGISSTEFSCASAFYQWLSANPSPVNKVAPFSFRYVYGVTPFPTRGNNALLTTLKTANTNIIGTGAEGGISNTILLWGTTEDGHDATYWYSVDWVQINIDEMVSNAIINGSNNSTNPLYYNQDGINRLQAISQTVMNNGISFGLVLGPASVAAVPFTTYVTTNPTDYPAGIYRGLSVTYTPQRGFTQIVFYVNVSAFPTTG